MFEYHNQQKIMFEFFKMRNAFFDSPFHSRRGGMRRLIPRLLAEALIRGEKAEVELPIQHYDEMKERKRNARSSFDPDLFLTD